MQYTIAIKTNTDSKQVCMCVCFYLCETIFFSILPIKPELQKLFCTPFN